MVDGKDPRRRRNRARGEPDDGFDERRGVFMISIAAELAGMHPQTLRMYEARGLITPKRSPKQTRLYSQADVERLRRIQRMTAEEGLNLAGVETVLDLEGRLERARREAARMRERAAELQREMLDEIERVKRSFRAEIVPYGAYEAELPEASGKPAKRGTRSVRIPVSRADGGRADGDAG